METKLSPLIGKEEIEVLVELCDRCYYRTNEEKKKFFKEVCESVGRNKLAEITEDEFEKAFNKARSILHKVGEAVFTRQINWHHYVKDNSIKFGKVS